MILSVVVTTCLTLEPALSEDELAAAPVETLGLRELEREDARLLLDEPSLTPPRLMIAVGPLATAAGLGLLIFSYAPLPSLLKPQPDGLQQLFADISVPTLVLFMVVGGVITLGSAALEIIGGRLLASRLPEHEAWQQRRESVRAQIVRVQSGRVSEPAPARADPPPVLIEPADRHRSIALPITLVIAGFVLLGAGAIWATEYASASDSSPAFIAMFSAAFALGATSEGIGLWLLERRLAANRAIDDEATPLPAPAHVALPPVSGPQLGWAWRF
jgi:hypothetical protein